jgi:hypothetical protein
MHAGDPPSWMWSLAGVPPFGAWVFLDPRPSVLCWHVSCPSCLVGRAVLLPSEHERYDYNLALEFGCTKGCPPELLAWWLTWRKGELPVVEPEEPTARARAYARKVAAGEISSLGRPSARQDPQQALRQSAYRIGQVLGPGGLCLDGVAEALILAGQALGISLPVVVALARSALMAGMAQPREVPR